MRGPTFSGHRKRSIRGFAIVCSIATMPIIPSAPFARQATPSPTRDAAPPELCRAESPSFEEINRLIVASARDRHATPVATPGIVPSGPDASAGVVAEVTTTVRELVACFNAGELLRAYGLYTDPYLGHLLARQGVLSRASYDSLATPMPGAPADRAAILSITDVRVVAPGRVGATVTIAYAVIPMPKTFFFTFVQVEERWLIDDILGEISFSVP